MANVSFSGGDKTKKFFKDAGKGGVKGLDVGVFESAKYPDGTLVAMVAAANEFGTSTIPERSAQRNANKSNEQTLIRLIAKTVDPKTMVITKRIANLIGVNHQSAIQKSIVDLRTPPNEPSTVKAKKSSNPLIDKGFYKNSITFKVIP